VQSVLISTYNTSNTVNRQSARRRRGDSVVMQSMYVLALRNRVTYYQSARR
jgi:hypothetical protein